MKKIAVILSVILAFSILLTGCGDSNTQTDNPSNSNSSNNNSNNTTNNQDTEKYDGGIFTPTVQTKITYEDVINAEPTSKKDFLYNELENSIEIYHYKGNAQIVVVPILINGKKVTSILRSTFKNANTVEAIVLPATITTLDGTFERLPNLKFVICDGVKKAINKPFDEAENVTIYCKQGSYMHSYAKSKKINYELVAEPTTEPTTSSLD